MKAYHPIYQWSKVMWMSILKSDRYLLPLVASLTTQQKIILIHDPEKIFKDTKLYSFSPDRLTLCTHRLTCTMKGEYNNATKVWTRT